MPLDVSIHGSGAAEDLRRSSTDSSRVGSTVRIDLDTELDEGIAILGHVSFEDHLSGSALLLNSLGLQDNFVKHWANVDQLGDVELADTDDIVLSTDEGEVVKIWQPDVVNSVVLQSSITCELILEDGDGVLLVHRSALGGEGLVRAGPGDLKLLRACSIG